jgi:hypothetical protein
MKFDTTQSTIWFKRRVKEGTVPDRSLHYRTGRYWYKLQKTLITQTSYTSYKCSSSDAKMINHALRLDPQLSDIWNARKR